MRKLIGEAKTFGTVIGLAVLAVAVVGGVITWEVTKWGDCLGSHGFLYCLAALE